MSRMKEELKQELKEEKLEKVNGGAVHGELSSEFQPPTYEKGIQQSCC